MRVLFIHPNYHSGGAEIAGNWPPAWVAYLVGALRKAGYQDIERCEVRRRGDRLAHWKRGVRLARPGSPASIGC